MQENLLFEYAVVRVVPRVEREEFINVGVILFCAKQKFLKVLYHFDKDRLASFSRSPDLLELEENLKAMERICVGGKAGGPIGLLSTPERFRWLTATRSTVVQSSKVHPGLCVDPDATLNKLFQQLVL